MAGFSSFIIVAEMRSGSNLLEACLNALDGPRCHGELFNGAFVGYPGQHRAFGIDAASRERDPAALLRAVAEAGPGPQGFRFFHDHDARVPALVVADPGCAIVRLSRNPVEAYVSRKIAQATGQWRLGDLADRRDARIRFDAVEFAEYLSVRDTFRRDFRHRLQAAGRTAYDLRYEELGDLDVLNGLAAWLGIDTRLKGLPRGIARQNPGPLGGKVENPDEMEAALTSMGFAARGHGGFRRLPGPGVPGYLIAARSGLMFQPLPGGPTARVAVWMEAIDGAAPETDNRQKALRDWQSAHPGHRSFTVLRHPLLRAIAALTSLDAPDADLPEGTAAALARYGVDATARPVSKNTLIAWLEFLAGNLAGQTSVPVNRLWMAQSDLIAGYSALRPPDLILREDNLGSALPALYPGAAVPPDPEAEALRFDLAKLVTPRIERLARRAYRRDYLTFGFSDWGSGGL